MGDDFLDNTLEVTISAEREAVLRKVRATGKAILILLIGGRTGERAILGDEPFVIGRGTSADLVLNSDAVSRVHARIEKRDNVHVLVDQGSTNGSFVNYQRVQERILRDGDQIQIGQSMLKYLAGDNIETAYHEEFRLLARRDALTGALNRATYDEEVELSISRAQRGNEPLCLVLFDLDHFKSINDRYGHTAGDLVLSRVSARALEDVEPDYVLARLGGEEFAVIVTGGMGDAKRLAEQVRRAIEALVLEYEHKVIAVTASFGIAEYTGQSAAQLYEEADQQLYRAKSGGRNRVCA